MQLDDIYDSLQAALRQLRDSDARLAPQVAGARAMIEGLVDLLIARGVLAPGHRHHLEGEAARAEKAARPRVRLRQFVDKYRITPADIDCDARLHLCHARCCSFQFELGQQDVDEGTIRWQLDDPYVIRQEADGYCTHIDRASHRCGVYEQRPATCRGFDCRHDPRIWLDFDQRIPAP